MAGTKQVRQDQKQQREQEQQQKQSEQKRKDDEDFLWKSSEHKPTKKDLKSAASESALDEKQKRDREKQRLAKLEEEDLASYGQKKSQAAQKKMTKFEIEQNKNASAKERLQQKFKEQKERELYVDVDAHENTNKKRDDVDIDSSGTIDLAVKELTGLDIKKKTQPVSMKAAYMAFEERELPTLKEDRPGLKKSQYDELLSKMWKKDPTNPINFVREGRWWWRWLFFARALTLSTNLFR